MSNVGFAQGHFDVQPEPGFEPASFRSLPITSRPALPAELLISTSQNAKYSPSWTFVMLTTSFTFGRATNGRQHLKE